MRERQPITVKSDIDPAIFDAALLTGIQGPIPPERLDAYLRELDQQFWAVANADPADPNIEALAHKIVSQAGMLGLIRMCECARQVEDACRAGTGRASAVHQFRAAVGDVRDYAMQAAGFRPS